ncbi:cold shock domain-containing protein [Flavobacterium sp. WV_118_3]|jgi:hypothetical protein|uniref:cold shock domain-containing protein n=1 Tax=Flavobacterium sp. WV_118_3 TaxID=3151764 RepID=UPI0012D1B008|nr:cold shock domain-containing protein [Flavobacterium sp.]HRB72385.1 cold shock domain-containing protein [Flavobacterium sp.]
MADSFSKKENNKKKQKKQQDKTSRREERKTNNNKGKSLDDMIIYIDVNGNFTSLPPHLQNKEEDFAKAKRAKKAQADMLDSDFSGIVSYMSEKGYGFITEDNTSENVFFHYGQLNEPVSKGDLVHFKKEQTPKGYQATTIKKK